MGRNDKSEQQNQKRRGKFTEGLLNHEVILKALDIKAGQTILDAGCGSGYMSKIFSKAVSHSGKVYALDRDHYFIDVLQDGTKGTNIKALEGDITTPTKLKRSSTDLVYISTVIHGLSQQQIHGFLREAKRLLKSDALLAIVEIEKKETPFGPPLRIRYSPDDLKQIIPMIPKTTVKVGEYFYMQIFQNK